MKNIVNRMVQIILATAGTRFKELPMLKRLELAAGMTQKACTVLIIQ